MLRVGVLRGGISNEYDESLASGAYVLAHLPRERSEAVDIFIDAAGAWHLGGKPLAYDALPRRVDVVWNALAGFYGADGKAAQALEALSVPYIGASPLSQALAMHRKFFRDSLAAAGVRTPRGTCIESWGEGSREDAVASAAAGIMRDFSPPWLVSPVSRAAAKAPVRAKTRAELAAALLDMSDLSLPALVEEEVFGRAASIICVPGFRGQAFYTFLPAGGRGGRADSAGEALRHAARAVHESLRLGPYSRIEAVVTPRGQVCVTSADTMPSFAPDSDIHEALAGVGASFEELANHLLFSTSRERA